MTQTPDNSGNSSRLDRIEAILEHSVSDQAKLRESLLQLTQRVDDMASDRSQLRESLHQLTQRVDTLTQREDNMVESKTQFEEKRNWKISELVRQREVMTEMIGKLAEIQADMKASEERQNRMLDYIQRQEKPDADS